MAIAFRFIERLAVDPDAIIEEVGRCARKLRVELLRPGGVSVAVRAYHLLHLRAGDVCVDADPPDPAELEEGEHRPRAHQVPVTDFAAKPDHLRHATFAQLAQEPWTTGHPGMAATTTSNLMDEAPLYDPDSSRSPAEAIGRAHHYQR